MKKRVFAVLATVPLATGLSLAFTAASASAAPTLASQANCNADGAVHFGGTATASVAQQRSPNGAPNPNASYIGAAGSTNCVGLVP
jgi:hypothetical protein